MAEPFLGEIKLVSFNFPPKGWAFCNGQVLAINQNQALFALLGTNYGGDGARTFQLPNLQGKVIVHQGTGSDDHTYSIGALGGATTVQITDATMPKHSHTMSVVSKAGTSPNPASLALAVAPAAVGNLYGASRSTAIMPANAIQYYGSNVPHTNMMPYLVLNYIIALTGIFPTQN